MVRVGGAVGEEVDVGNSVGELVAVGMMLPEVQLLRARAKSKATTGTTGPSHRALDCLPEAVIQQLLCERIIG